VQHPENVESMHSASFLHAVGIGPSADEALPELRSVAADGSVPVPSPVVVLAAAAGSFAGGAPPLQPA
jgi:hypothetical protein